MGKKKNNSKPQTEFYGKLRTPKGRASWAYLDEPQEDLNGKEQFKITLFFDKDDPEFKEFVKTLNGHRKTAAETFGKKAKDVATPIKKVDARIKENLADKMEVSVGDPFVEFKAQAGDGKEIKVVGADAKTEIDGGSVWVGSVCRVSAGVSGWAFSGNAGVKLYLNAVQVLELVTGSGGGLDVFEDESSEFDTDESDDDADELEEEDEDEFEEEDLV
jgi:hypothetical protein